MRQAGRPCSSNARHQGASPGGEREQFTRVDIKVAGVVSALKEAKLDFEKFPVIIR